MYNTRSPTHKSRSSALARAGMTKELTPAEGTAASRCPGSSKLRTADRQRTHMLLIMSVGRRSRSPWRPRPRWRWTSWRGLAGSDVGYCTSWGMCASVAGAGSDPIVAVRKPDHEIGHACGRLRGTRYTRGKPSRRRWWHSGACPPPDDSSGHHAMGPAMPLHPSVRQSTSHAASLAEAHSVHRCDLCCGQQCIAFRLIEGLPE